MKKFIVGMNFVSLILFFTILGSINIPVSGITGFATAVSSASFDFQPSAIFIFLFIFTTLVLNTYSVLNSRER